jgi:hypothetical protein
MRWGFISGLVGTVVCVFLLLYGSVQDGKPTIGELRVAAETIELATSTELVRSFFLVSL